jgi:hypothetical protein
MPKSILKIKQFVDVDNSTYCIDNLNPSCDFLIFSHLNKPLDNLPYELKELWLFNKIENPQIKLPFGCVIRHY